MRENTPDIADIGLGQSARQINTFVRGPNAVKTNTALRLREALTGVQKVQEASYKAQKEVNVARATEQKLYGGTLFSGTLPKLTEAYETNKESLGSLEQAEQFFRQHTTPTDSLTDAHASSGFVEAQQKSLNKFLTSHAEFLGNRTNERRTRDISNDFFFTVEAEGVETAFGRSKQIAENLGRSPDELNTVPLSVAEAYIAQGKFKQAEQILTFDRGPAGSLESHPQTAVEAAKLLSKVRTEDVLQKANDTKRLEDINTIDKRPFTDDERATLDGLLQSGALTAARRNQILKDNEKITRISETSTRLFKYLNEDGKDWTTPLVDNRGNVLNQEEQKAARKLASDSFYNQEEASRANGSVDPVTYINRLVDFAEKTNTTNPAIKTRLSTGFSALSPQDIITTGEIPQELVSSVADYVLIHKQNPQVAVEHLSTPEERKFFDEIALDISLGTFEGPIEQQIQTAVRNHAIDSQNPVLKYKKPIDDADIVTAIRDATEEATDPGFFGSGTEAINAEQWLPHAKRLVQSALRRGSSSDPKDIMKYVSKQIVSRNLIIGDRLVPRGTLSRTYTSEQLQVFNENTVGRFIAENPQDGYEADELVITPIVGQRDLWGVSVKGSGQILEVIRDGELPTNSNPRQNPGSAPVSNRELDQIKQDEGVVTNDAGEHVSYKDSRGFLTGGHGHLLTPEERKKYPENTPIPQDVIDRWLEEDNKEAEEDVAEVFGQVSNPEAELILKNMAFNLGRTKLNKFKELKKAIENEDYAAAAQAMKDSAWYKQTGNRSKRLVERMSSLA